MQQLGSFRVKDSQINRKSPEEFGKNGIKNEKARWMKNDKKRGKETAENNDKIKFFN